MSIDFITRAARSYHAEELTRIAYAAKRHWDYPEEYIELWRDGLTITERYVASNTVIMAQSGVSVLGFYALRREPENWLLDALFIDPPYIGGGVGSMLFQHACKRAQKAGGKALVLASDPNAEGFYRKHGAVKIGTTSSAPAGRTLPLMAVRLR